MSARRSAKLSTFGKQPCAQCGTGMIAPVWSEYVSERRVRHLWNCNDCGYVFETLVVYHSDEKSEAAQAPMAA